jgi:hypothetical protein
LNSPDEFADLVQGGRDGVIQVDVDIRQRDRLDFRRYRIGADVVGDNVSLLTRMRHQRLDSIDRRSFVL